MGHPNLSYIGFSQGTVQGFSALSVNHLLREKINLFIALAPVIKPHGLKNGTITALIDTSTDLIYLLFGRRCLLSSTNFWKTYLSRSIFAAVIDIAVKGLFDWKSQYLDDKRIIYNHLYSYSSVKIVVHWFQILRSTRLQMYDEALKNVPKYPTENIRGSLLLCFGAEKIRCLTWTRCLPVSLSLLYSA